MRHSAWRWLGWGAVLGFAALLVAGMTVFLQPPRGRSISQVVQAAERPRGAPAAPATLVLREDRWVGSVSEFPPGSVVHVRPMGSPGFFLMRSDGGLFRAVVDRSTHRGQPLEYRDPLLGSIKHLDGPQPGFWDPDAGSAFALDGEALSGPAPRPLDPMPVAIDGNRLEIGTRAICPSTLATRAAWCGGDGEGPRMLPPGRAVVLMPPDRWIDILSEPGLRAGAAPVRRLTEQELRALGFTVVDNTRDLARLGGDRAQVFWMHRDAMSDVDPAWTRARYEEGRAIGILDGTVADLVDHFGLGEKSDYWIQPGSGRPVFALTRSARCSASTGRDQASAWLSLAWLLAASREALTDACGAGAG